MFPGITANTDSNALADLGAYDQMRRLAKSTLTIGKALVKVVNNINAELSQRVETIVAACSEAVDLEPIMKIECAFTSFSSILLARPVKAFRSRRPLLLGRTGGERKGLSSTTGRNT